MIKPIVNNKFPILLVLTVVAIHISLIAFPQVNLEFAFIDGAKYFLSPELLNSVQHFPD